MAGDEVGPRLLRDVELGPPRLQDRGPDVGGLDRGGKVSGQVVRTHAGSVPAVACGGPITATDPPPSARSCVPGATCFQWT
jgi:hypothetical protein